MVMRILQGSLANRYVKSTSEKRIRFRFLSAKSPDGGTNFKTNNKIGGAL